jgi:CHASE3 domain sensor protein
MRSSSPTWTATRCSSVAFHSFISAASFSTWSCRRLIRSIERTRAESAAWSTGFVRYSSRASLEAGDDVLHVGHRRHHDDGREGEIRVGPQAPANLEAAELGHHQVKQDQVRQKLPCSGQAFFAVGRRDHLVALAAQPGLQNLDVGRVVVDDEDARGVLTVNSPDTKNVAASRWFYKAVRFANERFWSASLCPWRSLENQTRAACHPRLDRSPVGWLVGWVARVRASVHTKLLFAFLIITLLFIAMAVASLLMLASTTEQSRLLDQAHERVSWAQQSQHALARQMHFTALALLSKDEAAIKRILRENNRFNEALAKLDTAAIPGQKGLIDQIRASQDDAMAVMADIANAIRDGKLDDITGELLAREERLDAEIASRMGQLVDAEQDRMARLRDNVDAANRRSLILTSAFAVVAVLLAWLCGFVISWSFILPVREAQVFLGDVAAGNFGRKISVPQP